MKPLTLLSLGAVFLGALLLFLMQPLAARLVLPKAGGAPAVWSACMLFFQAALLAGYLYAHLLARLRVRAAACVHGLLFLLALWLLPPDLGAGAPEPHGSPLPWLLAELVRALGPLVLLLAAGTPLLTHWLAKAGGGAACAPGAAAGDGRRGDPYHLFAASNLGSLLGLLAFPLLLEPLLGARAQSRAWSFGFAALAALTLGCAVLARERRSAAAPAAASQAPRPGARDHARWLACSFVPSSLFLGTTLHITTDVAALPLLWVLPLALYLLSFILAFSPRLGAALARSAVLAGAGVVAGLAALLSLAFWSVLPLLPALALHLAALFLLALLCHLRLYGTRPPPRHLTGFYLTVALGGVLGGAFNAVVAPLLFDSVAEYPLALVAALLLRPRFGLPWLDRTTSRRVHVAADGFALALGVLGLPAAALLLSGEPLPLVQARSFFGVSRVVADERTGVVSYLHGTTLHGVQLRAAPARPTTYFHERTGIGLLLGRPGGGDRFAEIGVLGLGAGTLAAWGEPHRSFTFYEIDPLVERIARDERWFTFLRDSRARRVDVVLGDGRRSLAGAEPGRFDLLILDGFSSDAVPIHLLTLEAFELYRSRLAAGGVLAVHVTNRHLDLAPVVQGAAERLGFTVLEQRLYGPADLDEAALEFMARWLILVQDAATLEALRATDAFRVLEPAAAAPVWTDDHASWLGLWKRR